MRRTFFALLAALGLAAAAGPGCEKPEDPAVPAFKPHREFSRMHEAFLARGKAGPVGLLFLGDSITHGWTEAADTWQKHYGRYNPANFGNEGDRTQNLLWRIENGELDGISPKVVVLLIGTNNIGVDPPEAIARAHLKIIQTLRARLPQTKVLVLGLFPRGNLATGELDPAAMAAIREVNAALAKLDDGYIVRYLDLGEKFLVDGKMPIEITPDQIHISLKAYKIWAEAMQPLLEEMMR